jgi:DNA mismatch endonuclease (patch repair protein)
MKSVRRRDTGPELAVRRFLHANGLRFRLNIKELPGTPDIVLPRHRAVVFVHGCFWHGHDCPHGSVQARTNAKFWRNKIKDNRSRDARKTQELMNLGWRVITVWECESRNGTTLESLVRWILSRA